ncbi:flavin-containing amine oxidase-like protein [Leptodontidium sp. MPI-SDFR-AT-0119]|nr:flavin-containing amine oxidase-like protein [Leptodontidium sp. MPI-SDFR-AT-0119]
MSTLFISAPGALNQNEVNRHRNQNGVIADTQMSSTHSAMITAMNAAKLENSSTILSPKERQHVIIVGAGIAGLRAASVLKRHGVGVTILEGRPDRIGGRICTSRKHGKAARDIGAAWMHETSQNKLVQLIPKLGIEYYYDDGTPLYYTRDGRAGSQFKAKKVADEFADYVEWYYTANPDAPDRTVKEFVDEFVEKHPLITASERKWAPQATREVELWIGTSIEEASSKHLSYFLTERNLYMKGGYDKIVNWTAEPLLKDPDMIKMGEVVTDINWGTTDNSIVVHSQKGTYTADAVIVTVPLGCLRRNMINFSPPMPPSIQEGITSFSYGALGKVFVEFSEVFWPKDNDQFIYYPSPLAPGTPIDETSILSYATVTSNLWIMSGTKELCIQIAEPLTQRIEAISPDDTATLFAFFEPLFKLMRTEPYKDLPDLLNIETTHWTQDPLAGFGSYSVEKKGDDATVLVRALDEHSALRLQFAGEHCIETGNGCVHGAFETGEVAARNLLGVFGRDWDGLDTTARSVSP